MLPALSLIGGVIVSFAASITARRQDIAPTAQYDLGQASRHSAELPAMIAALEVMQDEYFEPWQGTWPSAIDWTAAVLGTHLPASISTISRAADEAFPTVESTEHAREDWVNRYFSQLIAFHYGQDWFALRQQANDDMLWVVLGWLEAIKFVHEHSMLRHGNDTVPWYGERFVAAFAHRSRVFWEIASKGWDEELCGGGMIWNSRLAPYKNAITNELWIAASISMYLHFPGDDKESPFVEATVPNYEKPRFRAHDRKYFRAAIKAYDWLMASNMTNEQGLYVDGFHIKGWRGGSNGSLGTRKCDVRDEMVYTYNQGVLLTGQRGLWQATGNVTYLEAGHGLIRNVIAATGWDLESGTPEPLPAWQGLGRLGVLEEQCDILGTCSQDGQTFKGIFFLHFNAFCKPLPTSSDRPFGYKASPKLAMEHDRQCGNYTPWVWHNTNAAALTRNEKGLFSMWWTEKLWPFPGSPPDTEGMSKTNESGTDYRNYGVPNDEVWMQDVDDNDNATRESSGELRSTNLRFESSLHSTRSVEIQSGGLSVFRAFVERKHRRDTLM